MIAVEDVRKRYGPLTAVDGVSFEVRRGEVVGFLGPNGAGKTTTMKMITGTLQPDEGAVFLDGVPVEEDALHAKRRIGYLPESNPLYDDLLVAEYLEYVAELRDLRPADARRHLSDAVDETGIGEVFYRPVGELSKGYRQRVGMAAAILHRPEVLILDEPTEGLDPNQRVDIRRLVGALGRERTVLLSTHVMQEVEATCTRLLILHRGRLVAEGSVESLLSSRSGATRYVVEVEGEGVVEALGSLPGAATPEAEERHGRTRVLLESRDGRELRPAISELARERSWVLWELYREQATLEEVFQGLTRSADGVEPTGSLAGSTASSAGPPEPSPGAGEVAS